MALSLVEMNNFETDCVLVDGQVKVRCHSVLLALVSELCSCILPQPGEDKEDTVIIMPDTGEDVLKLTVKLLYSGEVEYRGQTNLKDEILNLLTSLGVYRETVELNDVLVGMDKTVNDSEFGSQVQSGRPTHIVGPIYEEESDTADVSSDDGLKDAYNSSDAAVDACLPQHIISPKYDDSEEDEEESTVQADDACQVFSAPRVTFQVTEKSSSRCGKFCHAYCQTVYESWNPIQKVNLKALFEGDRSMDVKTSLLSHLRSQETHGLSTDGYHINRHTFCCSFLAYITGRSFFILKSVLEDFWRGVKIYEHGNAGIVKVKPASSVFIAWMKEFGECFGQAAPDENVTILSYWLSKKVLFDMYLNETVGPHLRQSTFYENFKTFFGPNRQDKSLPQIRISKFSSHSICNICAALNTSRRQSKNETELKIAKDKINHHKMTFGQARRKVDEIIQSAITFPSDNLGKP